MDAVAGERVEVAGKGGDEGLAFAGLHLGDLALVEDHAADELNIEVAHLHGTQASLADDGEGLGKDLFERGLLGGAGALGGVFLGGIDVFGGDGRGDALAELIGFGAQLLVGERLNGGLQSIDLRDGGKKALDRPFVTGAKDLCEDVVEQTGCPSGFRGHCMAQVQVYAMFAVEDRRTRSGFGRKLFYVLKLHTGCILLQAADVLRGRTGCGVCIQTERSFNPTTLEEP